MDMLVFIMKDRDKNVFYSLGKGFFSLGQNQRKTLPKKARVKRVLLFYDGIFECREISYEEAVTLVEGDVGPESSVEPVKDGVSQLRVLTAREDDLILQRPEDLLTRGRFCKESRFVPKKTGRVNSKPKGFRK